MSATAVTSFLMQLKIISYHCFLTDDTILQKPDQEILKYNKYNSEVYLLIYKQVY